MKEKLFVSSSFGKTSMAMSIWLKEAYSEKFDMRFIFANTGQEYEQTLEFGDRCDREFNLGIVWVEAVTNPIHGKGVRHKVVDFKTASRNGEPFESFTAKEGVPGLSHPKCSERLKAYAIESYKNSIGWSKCKHAIGIRIDEDHRVSEWAIKKYNLVYPFVSWRPTDKIDVNNFWEDQDFNLELLEHQGNCKTCWKKSDKKLFRLYHEDPQAFEFFNRMEQRYQHIKPNTGAPIYDEEGEEIARTKPGPRVFFRNHRSTVDLIAQAKVYNLSQLQQFTMFDDDAYSSCSESCESYSDL
jgi:hypothetical protein